MLSCVQEKGKKGMAESERSTAPPESAEVLPCDSANVFDLWLNEKTKVLVGMARGKSGAGW